MDNDRNDYDEIAEKIDVAILNLIGSTFMREDSTRNYTDVSIPRLYAVLEELHMTSAWAKGLAESHRTEPNVVGWE